MSLPSTGLRAAPQASPHRWPHLQALGGHLRPGRTAEALAQPCGLDLCCRWGGHAVFWSRGPRECAARAQQPHLAREAGRPGLPLPAAPQPPPPLCSLSVWPLELLELLALGKQATPLREGP